MEKTTNIELLKPFLTSKRKVSNEILSLNNALDYEFGYIQLKLFNLIQKKNSSDASYYYHVESKRNKVKLNNLNKLLEERYWNLRRDHEIYKKSIENDPKFEKLSKKHLEDLYSDYDLYKKELEAELNNDLSSYSLYKEDLVKKVDSDYKLMLKQLDKIAKYQDLVDELKLRIMNKDLIDSVVEIHKDEILKSNIKIHESLQQSRNALLINNENVFLYLKKYKKIASYQNRIKESTLSLDELDQKINQIAKSMENADDNHFIYMQENQDIHLSIRGLKMYFGGLKAVDDLNFDIKRGEIFSLIGPNGAGKTTVFNCITQFYKPTGGEIYFNNHLGVTKRLNDYKVHEIISQGISRTFQNVELINELTVFENLLVGAHSKFRTNLFHHMFKTTRARTEERILQIKAYNILQKLNLTQYMFSLPQGLPYGTLKRVELARALMSNPELIILDEPAAGLNETEIIELTNLIKTISKEFNLTIFLVEHDMGLVMNVSDRVCAISFGKMLAIGTPEEIQKNKLVQEAYLGGDRDE